jgi:phosphoribosylaminoimidazolecarboxamide formyltransferase/IMP cyclohydrolase
VRDAPEAHVAQAMGEHGIGGIDLLYVNLYPFEATVAAGADYETAVENIDIGGPAMIRSGAKNHGYVASAPSLPTSKRCCAELKAQGGTSLSLRKRLAARAYARTAAYDAAISGWFAAKLGEAAPARRAFAGELAQTMRYGENPHQAAAFYRFANPRPAWRRPSSCRARSFPTTTSTTPTQPSS